MKTIRGSKGLGACEIGKGRTASPDGGTVYQTPSWWAWRVGPDGEDLGAVAGPASSEAKIRREVAALRRLIVTGEYAPR